MADTFTIETAKEALTRFKAEREKQALSPREIINSVAPQIQSLIKEGHSLTAIYTYMKETFNLRLGRDSFRTYVYGALAEKRRKAEGRKAETRKQEAAPKPEIRQARMEPQGDGTFDPRPKISDL